MTQLEIQYRYSGEPKEAELFALGNAREVYGIRRIAFDREAHTLLVEYDATRLNAATVTGLVRRAGVQIVEVLPLVQPPPPPAAEAAPAPAKA
jgi:hypothetical protein